LPDPTEADTGRSRDYVPPTTRLEKFLYEMWKDILGIEKIGIHDNFFELGGSSIQAASFVNRLQDALGEYVYIVAIYDAPTIAELRDYLRREYPEGVYRLTGEKVEKRDGAGRISAEDVERLRSIIKSPGPYIHKDGRRKNPPAIFVLSAPRSGSTLTRAILGGHPKLFSPPELQLLNYDTLGERKRQLSSGRDDFWLDGTIRALMEIRNCSVEQARELMAELEERDLPVQEFYRLMQEWLGDRIFVDKTPNYALSPHILQRAEEYFENNRYIHLIRHPYGVIPSFERARLHVFYPPFFTEEHGFTPRQLAELVWIISNQNILNFLKHIPEERQFRLYYEDLVTKPDETIRRICDFLEIEPHPDMFEPQKDAKKRMLDGLNDLSKMLGDVRFHEHKGISADRAYSWKKELTEDYLSDIAWELVEGFGYEPRSKLEISTGKILRPLKPLEKGEEPPLSFSQQRLWFLDQLQPDSPFYNMPMTVRLRGKLNPDVFERALNEVVRRHEVLRTAFVTDEEGKPRAKVLEQLQVRLELQDLTDVPADRRLEVLTDLVREEARRPFNLASPPLLRARLYTLDEDDRVLLLNMHHIISDGLSLEIFLRELSAVYAAYAEGKPSPLEPLKLQYGAFAKWQREWLESEALQKQLQYWKDHLQGVPGLLQLPLDHPRPKVQSYRGAKRTLELSPELTDAVRRLAARFRTTPYVITLAAYAALLHRYSGQEAFCVGTPVSGRTRRELEELIGFFVNTLPLRFDFSAGESFADLLKKAQQTIQDALAHQDVPLERILDELDLERDTSYNPLFQTVFIYEQNPLQKIDVGQLRVEPLAVDTGTAKFDLSLAIVENEEQLRCVWEYNTDLFAPETIEDLAKHFENLLHSATADPERAVEDLDLLSAEERIDLVAKFSRSKEFAVPSDETVASLLARVANEHGSQAALRQSGQVLSYAELDERANRLANFLVERGVGPETLVGVALDRSFDLFVAILGTLKAGAAYVPIDPLYPRERIEHIVRDSRLPLLLTSEKLAGLFEGVSDGVVSVDTEWEEIARYPKLAPRVRVDGENLVYAIYTSGSTGVPKGVAVRQRALLNHVLAMRQDMGLTPDDRVLQYISMSFDASGEEIYPTLASGATLVLPPSARELSAEELLDIVRSEGVTVLHLPVPIWHLIVDTLREQGKELPDSVRLVMVGGEAPSVQKLKEASQVLSHPIQFMNLYGPTEATITSTYYRLELTPEQALDAQAVPIGKPIANVRTYVLDSRLAPVPVGVIGELVIGGEGLARGYIGRPDQTAEVFVPDPFAGVPGARMYRTGDLVRLTRSGDLIFAGRADSQVKVRGLRIELGEIEHHLLRHPGVREGVVAAKQSERGTRLVAYVVAAGEKPSPAELRDFLKSVLPDYMVPSAYVFLEELPTTPSGKIDMRRLPEPDFGSDTTGVEFVPPRNAREEILVEIWKQVL
ncbi:MAG: amino acid adenylation domain-containing protein, partial [Calditrichaeota bacterium]|nr:amino acid adenylation domain-containing protein [Calditrichota bacterium]